MCMQVGARDRLCMRRSEENCRKRPCFHLYMDQTQISWLVQKETFTHQYISPALLITCFFFLILNFIFGNLTPFPSSSSCALDPSLSDSCLFFFNDYSYIHPATHIYPTEPTKCCLYMSMWMEGISQGPATGLRAAGKWYLLRHGEWVFSQDKCPDMLFESS